MPTPTIPKVPKRDLRFLTTHTHLADYQPACKARESVACSTTIADVKDPNLLAQLDSQMWDAVKSSQDPEDFRDYLCKFPKGIFAAQALRRIDDYRVIARVDSQLARIMQQSSLPFRVGDRGVQPGPRTRPAASAPAAANQADSGSKSMEADGQMKHLTDQIAEIRERQAWTFDIVKFAFPAVVTLTRHSRNQTGKSGTMPEWASS